MKHIDRSQNGEHHSLRVTLSGQPGWNTHSISCSELDLDFENHMKPKPPTARISPTSFSGGTAEQLRAYALELIRLADIAEDFEEEMRKIFTEKWQQYNVNNTD